MILALTIDENALWSGAVGSLLSAAIGLLTALLAVWLSNKNIKKEKEDDRTIRSIADIIASTQEIRLMQTTNKSSDYRFHMDAALTRLRLSHGRGEELFAKLREWPFYLIILRETMIVEEFRINAAVEADKTFQEAITILQDTLPEWVVASNRQRDEILGKLDAEARKIQDVTDEILEMMRES